jgi:DNA-directed RNA polymerase subunit omega
LEKLEFVDSKFRLAILAAKRAKQLVGGAKRRIDTDADNPLNVALEELFEGKINFQVIEEYEKEAAEQDVLGSITDDSEPSFLFRNDDEDVSSLDFNKDDDEDEDEEQDEAQDEVDEVKESDESEVSEKDHGDVDNSDEDGKDEDE